MSLQRYTSMLQRELQCSHATFAGMLDFYCWAVMEPSLFFGVIGAFLQVRSSGCA
jgi:hypothetical protein